MSKGFDVVVVGSGPAGAKTAYELSRKGYSVLILEKEELPRYKACGGGLPLKAIEEIEFDLSPVVEKRVNGACLTLDSEDPVMLETEGIGVMVMRERFDSYLAEKAVEAGAVLSDCQNVRSVRVDHEGCKIKTDDNLFECSVLVGADGANSIVAKYLGLRRKREMGMAIEREVSVEDWQLARQEDYATLDFGTVPYGYAWIFPKRKHLSIGVYTAQRKMKNLEDYLERFIGRQKVLRGCRTISNVWHPVPLGGRREKLHHKRALLVGDAAGLADPFFGEGIAFALKSAGIAADKIDDFLSGRTGSLKEYSERIYRDISSDFRYARHIHKVFSLNPGLSHRLFCKNRIINSYFVEVLKGSMKFRELFFRSILTFPRWIWGRR